MCWRSLPVAPFHIGPGALEDVREGFGLVLKLVGSVTKRLLSSHGSACAPYRLLSWNRGVRFAHRPPLLAAGEKPGAHMSTTRCVNVHARPRPRHSGPRLALPAPRANHTWPTVLPLLCSRPARIGALDRNAQQPFCLSLSRIMIY